MRTLLSCWLAVAGVVWLATGAPAQSDRAPGGRGTGSRQLIQNESVHRELELTAEQIRQLKAIPDQVREKLKDHFAEMVSLEGQARREKSVDVRKRYTEEYLKALARVLTPAQKKRLDQISLQHSGVQAFTEPEVQTALRPTAEQKEKLEALMQEAQKATLQAIQQIADKDAAAEKIAAADREAMKKAQGLLTPEQRRALKDLLGEPFEVKVAKVMIPPSPGAAERTAIGRAARPGTDRRDLQWVAKRVDQWQPTAEEHRMDQIGWASGIREALRLGKANGRPAFLFNYSGRIGAGRC